MVMPGVGVLESEFEAIKGSLELIKLYLFQLIVYFYMALV